MNYFTKLGLKSEYSYSSIPTRDTAVRFGRAAVSLVEIEL